MLDFKIRNYCTFTASINFFPCHCSCRLFSVPFLSFKLHCLHLPGILPAKKDLRSVLATDLLIGFLSLLRRGSSSDHKMNSSKIHLNF